MFSPTSLGAKSLPVTIMLICVCEISSADDGEGEENGDPGEAKDGEARIIS